MREEKFATFLLGSVIVLVQGTLSAEITVLDKSAKRVMSQITSDSAWSVLLMVIATLAPTARLRIGVSRDATLIPSAGVGRRSTQFVSLINVSNADRIPIAVVARSAKKIHVVRDVELMRAVSLDRYAGLTRGGASVPVILVVGLMRSVAEVRSAIPILNARRGVEVMQDAA